MKKTPTYKEQFDKLTKAYINDEVEPMFPCACFIGNLLNGRGDWVNMRRLDLSNYTYHPYKANKLDPEYRFYTATELAKMENMFMTTPEGYLGRPIEETFFRRFSTTLDILKQIHISKGEVIDDVPVFKKRELKTV